MKRNSGKIKENTSNQNQIPKKNKKQNKNAQGKIMNSMNNSVKQHNMMRCDATPFVCLFFFLSLLTLFNGHQIKNEKLDNRNK